jgi:hypothetical protein
MTNEELIQTLFEDMLLEWGHLTWNEYFAAMGDVSDLAKDLIAGCLGLIGVNLNKTILEAREIFVRGSIK